MQKWCLLPKSDAQQLRSCSLGTIAWKAFMEESRKFYLSHRGPVAAPIESAVTHDASPLAYSGLHSVDFLQETWNCRVALI